MSFSPRGFIPLSSRQPSMASMARILLGLSHSDKPTTALVKRQTSRVTWIPAQYSNRQFSSSTLCRPNLFRSPIRSIQAQRVRLPQTRHQYQKTYFQDPVPSPLQEPVTPPPGRLPNPGLGGLVILGLVGSCVAVFLRERLLVIEYKKNPTLEARDKLARFYEHFTMSAQSLEPGRYYTIITSAFAHSGVLHLAFNMMALASFGSFAIRLMGVPSFLALYFGSIAAGGVAQIKFWEMNRRPHVAERGMGASGGIMGIFGAVACIMPMSQMSFLIVPMPMYVGALLNVAVSTGGMQGSWLPAVGHADHLGGMAFGMLFWLVAIRRGNLARMFKAANSGR